MPKVFSEDTEIEVLQLISCLPTSELVSFASSLPCPSISFHSFSVGSPCFLRLKALRSCISCGARVRRLLRIGTLSLSHLQLLTLLDSLRSACISDSFASSRLCARFDLRSLPSYRTKQSAKQKQEHYDNTLQTDEAEAIRRGNKAKRRALGVYHKINEVAELVRWEDIVL